MEKCTKCGGIGKYFISDSIVPNAEKITCEECGGTGIAKTVTMTTDEFELLLRGTISSSTFEIWKDNKENELKIFKESMYYEKTKLEKAREDYFFHIGYGKLVTEFSASDVKRLLKYKDELEKEIERLKENE